MSTTNITVQGVNYTIPSDKVHLIVELLKAYRITQTKNESQVREVLTNNPNADGRTLING